MLSCLELLSRSIRPSKVRTNVPLPGEDFWDYLSSCRIGLPLHLEILSLKPVSRTHFSSIQRKEQMNAIPCIFALWDREGTFTLVVEKAYKEKHNRFSKFISRHYIQQGLKEICYEMYILQEISVALVTYKACFFYFQWSSGYSICIQVPWECEIN